MVEYPTNECEILLCICPEFPGNPSFGFAMKHGMIPYFDPKDLTTYLVSLSQPRTCNSF